MIDTTLNYKIADINLADWGRKEIEISEKEMNVEGSNLFFGFVFIY